MSYKWSLITHLGRDFSIEPTVNSCRIYDCCGECGMEIDQIKDLIIHHYESRIKGLSSMSEDEFLSLMGYPNASSADSHE